MYSRTEATLLIQLMQKRPLTKSRILPNKSSGEAKDEGSVHQLSQASITSLEPTT